MIVLDTHVWLWWIGEESNRLRSEWRELIEGSERVAIAGISLFEVAWLSEHNRIALSEDADSWMEKATSGSGIDVLALSPRIAYRSVTLPWHHKDPQDRIIIATALEWDAKLISADKSFELYTELGNSLA